MDYLRRLVPVDIHTCAFRETDPIRPNTIGIQPHGERIELSSAHRARDRYLPASSIREARRCRALLKRLLRPLEGVDEDEAAGSLMAHFGSLRAAIVASPQEQLLAAKDRRVVAHLGAIRQTMHWTLRTEVETRPILGSSQALRDYLRLAQAFDRHEYVRIFYLNSRNRLLREECLDRGTPDQSIASPRQIIVRGLELGATGIIICHNHPSGDPAPSMADKAITRRIAVAAQAVDLRLLDHLIVAEGGEFSFREQGLL